MVFPSGEDKRLVGRRNQAPERLRQAVLLLDVRPGDQILEIGCGAGVAVSLVCERLKTGRITAIDRSEVAVERAARRNAEHVAAGRARIACLDLADARRLDRRFDKVFAVNVNVFWTRRADAELDVISTLMRPDATVHLCYEAPPGGTADQAAQTVRDALTRHGFSAVTTNHPPALVCVSATRRCATGMP